MPRYVDIFGTNTWEANQYRSLARLNGHRVANQWADAMLGHGRTNYPVPAPILEAGWKTDSVAIAQLKITPNHPEGAWFWIKELA